MLLFIVCGWQHGSPHWLLAAALITLQVLLEELAECVVFAVAILRSVAPTPT